MVHDRRKQNYTCTTLAQSLKLGMVSSHSNEFKMLYRMFKKYESNFAILRIGAKGTKGYFE